MSKHLDCKLEGYAAGDGPKPSEVMLVGEALGETEVSLSKSFVGRSGKRLAGLLALASLKREQVYVTNVVKHRPPGNRPPTKQEIEACQFELIDEIKAVKPKIIIALGAGAASWFLPKVKLAKTHGRPQLLPTDHPYAPGVILVPWYDPAAGFRSGAAYRRSIEDAKELWDKVRDVVRVEDLRYSLVDNDAAFVYAWSTPVADIGFDIETTSWTVSRQRRFGDIVGYSLSTGPLSAVYVPDKPSREVATSILSNPMWRKICYNAKFEYRELKKIGIEMMNFEDPMGMAYLLGYAELGLKSVTNKILHTVPTTFDEAAGGVDTADVSELRKVLAENYTYGCADSDNVRRLYYILRHELVKEGLLKVYEEIERPLISVLADMEAQGIQLDLPRLRKLRDRIARIRDIAKQRANALLGSDIVNSRQKLAIELARLGAPIKKKTKKKGLFATDYDTLTRIRDWNPKLIDAILAYYRYTKLLAFPDTWLKLEQGGRLYTNFNQFGRGEDDDPTAPATGRLSSSGPNVQQIPHTGDKFLTWWGKRLRQCFVAGEGWRWLKGDFAQQEARIIAVASGDEALIRDFNENQDVYSFVASDLYGVPVTKKSDPQKRFFGKTFFLAKAYGSGADKLTQIDPTITLRQAEVGIARMEARYPKLAAYTQNMTDFVKEHGYVKTLFGRKRLLPEALSSDFKLREEAYRQAANTPIQGTGADVVKKVLIKIARRLDRRRAILFLTVHDDINCLVRPGSEDYAMQVIAEAAKEVGSEIGINLPMEFSVGYTWADCS